MRKHRSLSTAAVVVTALMALGACSSSDKSAASKASDVAPTGAAVALNGALPTPKATVRDAVTALLTAEQHGDHAASFLLIDDAGRADYPDVLRWRDRRNELPAITGFRIVGNGKAANSVDVLVEHAPALDPFIGLSPAQEHEIWVGRREHGGWLLDADATSDPVLPADSGVAPAAMAWLQAAKACDANAVNAAQGVTQLLGVGNAVDQLCAAKPVLDAGKPGPVKAGAATQQLVAQYNADAVGWARSVTLTGGTQPIDVLLAPIGDAWRVIGVFS
jgi:hypothetical protein